MTSTNDTGTIGGDDRAAANPSDEPTRRAPVKLAAPARVETYGPDAFAGGGFAFDGTIVDIAPPAAPAGELESLDLQQVTSQVHHRYAGGDEQPEVTVAIYRPTPSSGDHVTSYDVSSRQLVSGEPRCGGPALHGPMAWRCGFTRTTRRHAAAWAEATSR